MLVVTAAIPAATNLAIRAARTRSAAGTLVVLEAEAPAGNRIPGVVKNEVLLNTDASGEKTLVTEEGDYMVTVQATNPVTGTSSIVRRGI